MITKEQLLNNLPNEWKEFIGLEQFDRSYWNSIIYKLNEDEFYPSFNDIFKVFQLIKPKDVKVVIIGQDPYIKENQAIGLSFSVKNGLKIPPSLLNIFKELIAEYNIKDSKDLLTKMKTKGDLTELVNEGVLLLNSVLTVKKNKSASHYNIGWEHFTKRIIKRLDKNNNCVFIAMGKYAQELLNKYVKLNQVIAVGHPSPLNSSNPFIGCNCFKTCNKILIKKYNIRPINWIKIFE